MVIVKAVVVSEVALVVLPESCGLRPGVQLVIVVAVFFVQPFPGQVLIVVAALMGEWLVVEHVWDAIAI